MILPGIPCRAVLFDLDGVLVDSTAAVERAWSRWAGEHGLNASEILAIAHGRRTVETIALVAPEMDAAQQARILERRELSEAGSVEEIAGARALLRRLPGNTWAVVTSGPRELARARIQMAGLPLPKVLVCAGDVEEGKPSPEGYMMAAGLLGVPCGDCVVVEDAPAGVAAARAAGATVVALTTTHPSGELAEADVVVEGLRDFRVRRRGEGMEILVKADE